MDSEVRGSIPASECTDKQRLAHAILSNSPRAKSKSSRMDFARELLKSKLSMLGNRKLWFAQASSIQENQKKHKKKKLKRGSSLAGSRREKKAVAAKKNRLAGRSGCGVTSRWSAAAPFLQLVLAEMSRSSQASRSVFVGNIPYSATEEQLEDVFRTVGHVVSFRSCHLYLACCRCNLVAL